MTKSEAHVKDKDVHGNSPPALTSVGFSIKHKLVALILILVFSSGVGCLAVMTIDLISRLRSHAEHHVTTATDTAARLVATAQEMIEEFRTTVELQMLGQAELVAHLVALAEKAGESPDEVESRLKEIVRKTDIDEFRITDPKGHVYLTNVDGDYFQFSADPHKQPQNHIFYNLLKGTSQTVIQKAYVRQSDNTLFKYVGSQGVDKPRIVQVGRHFEFMEDFVNRVGLKWLVKIIARDEQVESIWAFDQNLSILAHNSTMSRSSESATDVEGSVLGVPSVSNSSNGSGGDSISDDFRADKLGRLLSADDKSNVDFVMKSNKTLVTFANGYINAISPVRASNSQIPRGVLLIRFNPKGTREVFRKSLRKTLGIGGIAFIFAMIIAAIVGSWLSRPILALTTSVRALYKGQLNLSPTVPFTNRKDELGTFVREFQRMARDIHQKNEELDRLVKERTKALENAQKKMSDEVDLASSFQAALLPTPPVHENFTGHGFMRPAQGMAGDFYDIFHLDKDRVCLAIADVAGKGIPAAFFMAVCRTELRNESMSCESPATILERVNARLCEGNPLELFITVFYAILDHKKGILKYANGGHNPPYIISSQSRRVEKIPPKGDIVLGVIPDATFQEDTIQLCPNDTLLLYTDGICEAFNSQEEEFSNKRMEEVLHQGSFKNAKEVINSILSAVDRHVGEAPQSDDMTGLAIRWLGREDYQTKVL